MNLLLVFFIIYHVGIFLYLWIKEGNDNFLSARPMYLMCFLIPIFGTFFNTIAFVFEIINKYKNHEN